MTGNTSKTNCIDHPITGNSLWLIVAQKNCCWPNSHTDRSRKQTLKTRADAGLVQLDQMDQL